MTHLLIRIENFNSKILNNGIFPSGYVLKLIMINLNFQFKNTYRSSADMVGGSARNSNSGGGSLGTGGSAIVTGVCCIKGFG